MFSACPLLKDVARHAFVRLRSEDAPTRSSDYPTRSEALSCVRFFPWEHSSSRLASPAVRARRTHSRDRLTSSQQLAKHSYGWRIRTARLCCPPPDVVGRSCPLTLSFLSQGREGQVGLCHTLSRSLNFEARPLTHAFAVVYHLDQLKVAERLKGDVEGAVGE